MSWSGLLKSIAKGFVAVGHGALKTGLFISQHPEVLQAAASVAVVAGAPAAKVGSIAADVALGAQGIAGGKAAVDAAKTGDLGAAASAAIDAAQAGKAIVNDIKH